MKRFSIGMLIAYIIVGLAAIIGVGYLVREGNRIIDSAGDIRWDYGGDIMCEMDEFFGLLFVGIGGDLLPMSITMTGVSAVGLHHVIGTKEGKILTRNEIEKILRILGGFAEMIENERENNYRMIL